MSFQNKVAFWFGQTLFQENDLAGLILATCLTESRALAALRVAQG